MKGLRYEITIQLTSDAIIADPASEISRILQCLADSIARDKILYNKPLCDSGNVEVGVTETHV